MKSLNTWRKWYNGCKQCYRQCTSRGFIFVHLWRIESHCSSYCSGVRTPISTSECSSFICVIQVIFNWAALTGVMTGLPDLHCGGVNEPALLWATVRWFTTWWVQSGSKWCGECSHCCEDITGSWFSNTMSTSLHSREEPDFLICYRNRLVVTDKIDLVIVWSGIGIHLTISN